MRRMLTMDEPRWRPGRAMGPRPLPVPSRPAVPILRRVRNLLIDFEDRPRPMPGLSGVWDDITSGIGKVVSTAAPAFLQIEVAKAQARAQGAAVSIAGQTLYTPENIAALQRQQAFETAQRSIDYARSSNEIIPGVSPWVLLAGVVGLGSVLFLASRKGGR